MEKSRRFFFIGLLSASALYLSMFFDRGWIPHDEGVLGQQAVRWLGGELPHRDFHEVYSGGLTVLNGLAFKAFGVSSLSLRYMLLGTSLLCLSAVFLTLANALPPWAAAVATLAALTWSFPNYFAGLPSWYVAAFWCWGVYFVDRHDREGEDRAAWLSAAGVCAGLAVLMKISGIFFLPAAVLSLCHRALTRPRPAADPGGKSLRGGAAVVLAVSCHAAGVLVLFSRLPTGGVFLNLLLPNFALDLALAGALWKNGPPSRDGTRRLLVQTAALSAGFLLVIVPPVLWYAHKGALGDLVEGVFIRSARRTAAASLDFPGWIFSSFGLLFAFFVGAGLGRRPALDKRVAWALAAAFTVLLLLSDRVAVYRVVFHSFRMAPPFLAGLLLSALWWKGEEIPSRQSRRVFRGVAFMTLCSLIQFPFAHAIYFCYTAPFVWMLLAAAVGTGLLPWPRTALVTAGFYLFFAAFTMNVAGHFSLGAFPSDKTPSARLDLPRSPLAAAAAEKAVWQPLVQRVQSLTREGEPIFAGPDCPEVYFLSGRANPTKILYEVFEDQDGLEGRILSDIERSRCRVVVVNFIPEFSRLYSRGFLGAVAARFPRIEKFGHFVLFWRQAS